MVALYALADIDRSLNVGLAIKRIIGACCAVLCFEPFNYNLGVLRDATTNW